MDRLEIIEGLKHLPDAVLAEIAGLSDATLRYRPAEGEWSIKEVVGHLRDGAEHWSRRFYQVFAQNDPVFAPWDEQALVRDNAYQDADVGKLIADMREYRLKAVDLLCHAVDWSRLGQQQGVGRRSLRQFAESQIAHDENHLAQIRALKAAQAAAATR